MEPLYAHGKLLISAEYMVLHGSKALAVPLQLGQSLKRRRSPDQNKFSWKAFNHDRLWFSATLDPRNIKVIASDDPIKAEYLCRMIRACIDMMPSFQEDLYKWDVETYLEFSPEWGFGSSSTLTALLSEWAEVNPLDLHFMTSEGSGYDVACAIAHGPIVYRLREDAPHYQHVVFHPPFSRQLYFAWLGSKQPTAIHLKKVAEKIKPDYETIHRFSVLTEEMMQSQELEHFQSLIEEHEEVLSGLLEMERVSISRFPGLHGTVKSLGAWGGDFVLIASELPERELFDYLYQQEIEVIFRYQDLVYHGGAL
jgi:mevalonate kinase